MDNRQGKETGRLKMCLKQKTVSDFQTTCRRGGSDVFRNTFRVCDLIEFLRAPS
ncbi:type I restriction-modification system R subunit [Neisseria macacae ATCC 33926]|uniref:Type I restriction-modification system R subunit n=1 Tax=Neisseria macacae ATCC 33926 TaxID=997348 RepID=A0AA36UKM3_9NEIS|nr:type I restriction-modification system R subunit [Neisseria macacae ATCC 33926]